MIFGLFHLINLISGANLYGTLLQVIYASCFGIGMAYLYIKTRDLLPCILIHYLFDSFGQIFLMGEFANLLSASLFAILGIGVFPTLVTIFLVKVLFKDKKI